MRHRIRPLTRLARYHAGQIFIDFRGAAPATELSVSATGGSQRWRALSFAIYCNLRPRLFHTTSSSQSDQIYLPQGDTMLEQVEKGLGIIERLQKLGVPLSQIMLLGSLGVAYWYRPQWVKEHWRLLVLLAVLYE